MAAFKVIKRDAQGNDELSYSGIVRERNDRFLCIEAAFASPDRDLGYIHLRRGDVFREWFYSDCWFNIFRVQDAAGRQVKGWYCNITRPAIIEPHQVAADDLGLDVFVYPDGRTLLLDEDEFARLNLPLSEQQAAWEAVAAIKAMVQARRPPFDEIPSETAASLKHPNRDE